MDRNNEGNEHINDFMQNQENPTGEEPDLIEEINTRQVRKIDEEQITLNSPNKQENSMNVIQNEIPKFENNMLEFCNQDPRVEILLEKKGRKKKILKIQTYSCEGCNSKENIKLLRCYTCKKMKCKNCSDKEHHYSTKKRDQSIFICSDCFEGGNSKIRKKQILPSEDYQLMIDLNFNDQMLQNYTNFNYLNNANNFSPEIRFSNRKKWRRQLSEKILSNYENNPEILDVDELHECASLPSELKEENNFDNSIKLSEQKKKILHRKRNLNNLKLDKICHYCLKSNMKFEYLKCGYDECEKYYCIRCIGKFSQNKTFMKNDPCFACQKICNCTVCLKLNTQYNSNYTNIDLSNLKAGKNLVKIDGFYILENEVPEDDSISENKENEISAINNDKDKESNFKFSNKNNKKQSNNIKINIKPSNTNKNLNSVEIIKKTGEDNIKVSNKRVEKGKYNKIAKSLLCIFCNKDKLNNNSNDLTFRFKSLEEFIHCLNSFYSTKNLEEQPEYKHSYQEFQDYYNNYFNKFYSKSDYIFKSIKIICKDCFDFQLKKNNGFNIIFNSLHIGNQILNNKSSSKNTFNAELTNLKINQSFEVEQGKENIEKENGMKRNLSSNNVNLNIFSTMKSKANNVRMNELDNTTSPIQSNNIKLPITNQALYGNNSNNSNHQILTQNKNINKLLEILGNNKNQSTLQNLLSNNIVKNNLTNFTGNNINHSNSNQENSQYSALHRKVNESSNSQQQNNTLNNEFKSENNCTNNNMRNNEHDKETNPITSSFLADLFSQIGPDALNVSSIIMNLEPNSKNSNGENSYNILDELRKQFFCIQYYSLIQKLFISYIFKNLEMFIEQISKNQSLGEFVINSMINTLPKPLQSKRDFNMNELQIFVENINTQANLLKSISTYGVNLTNALNSNFEDLKNNGIKIFKTMDPNIQKTITNNINHLLRSNQNNMNGSNSNGNPVQVNSDNNSNTNNSETAVNNNISNANNIHDISNNSNVNSNNNEKHNSITYETIMSNLNSLNNISNPTQLNTLINMNQLGQLSQLIQANKIPQKNSLLTNTLNILGGLNRIGNINPFNNNLNFPNNHQGSNLNLNKLLSLNELLTNNNSTNNNGILTIFDTLIKNNNSNLNSVLNGSNLQNQSNMNNINPNSNLLAGLLSQINPLSSLTGIGGPSLNNPLEKILLDLLGDNNQFDSGNLGLLCNKVSSEINNKSFQSGNSLNINNINNLNSLGLLNLLNELESINSNKTLNNNYKELNNQMELNQHQITINAMPKRNVNQQIVEHREIDNNIKHAHDDIEIEKLNNENRHI